MQVVGLEKEEIEEMIKGRKKLCPLLSTPDVWKYCTPYCAWWYKERGECAILTLAGGVMVGGVL